MNRPDDQEHLVLHGARYSVYTRICLSALEMKRVPFVFEPVDVFSANGPAEARRAGHPFGKIPILHHDSIILYETLAITRYIDDRFDGPPLQPDGPADRARMNQFVSIVDTQVYPVLVWGLHVPKSEGREPDPDMPGRGRAVLAELERLAGSDWLCGPRPTLADAYLAACMDYVLDSAIGSDIAGHWPRLAAWWQRAQALRPET